VKKDAPASGMSMHKIMDIDEVAKIAFENFTRAYLDIEKFKKEKKDYFEKRSGLFKRECRNFMTKLHKFVSHFLMQTQEKILSSEDEDFTKWGEQMTELTQLRDSENFNELFLRRKDIQNSKKKMRDYLTDLSMHVENNIFDDIKEVVCNRVIHSMNDLFRILNFSIDENNLNQFDDFLSTAKVDEINYQLSQRTYLYE
jgi:hypothetical protein